MSFSSSLSFLVHTDKVFLALFHFETLSWCLFISFLIMLMIFRMIRLQPCWWLCEAAHWCIQPNANNSMCLVLCWKGAVFSLSVVEILHFSLLYLEINHFLFWTDVTGIIKNLILDLRDWDIVFWWTRWLIHFVGKWEIVGCWRQSKCVSVIVLCCRCQCHSLYKHFFLNKTIKHKG